MKGACPPVRGGADGHIDTILDTRLGARSKLDGFLESFLATLDWYSLLGRGISCSGNDSARAASRIDDSFSIHPGLPVRFRESI